MVGHLNGRATPTLLAEEGREHEISVDNFDGFSFLGRKGRC